MRASRERALPRRARALALLALLLAGCLAEERPAGPAPPFTLPDLEGRELALADLAGRTVVVDFWATWCEPCKDSFPHHAQLAEKYAGQVVVVAISIDDDPGGIADFAKKNGAKFNIGWDEGQAISGTYQPPTMPTAYIIDKNGIVRYVHAGFRKGDEVEIDAHVAELLK